MSDWPYPGDSPLARARRVARAYREHLHQVDPLRCNEVDEQMAGWGQGWIAPRVLRYELDDWLSLADAADVAAVERGCLRQWRARGKIVGRHTTTGWQYRARDVLRLASEVRRRAAPPEPADPLP